MLEEIRFAMHHCPPKFTELLVGRNIVLLTYVLAPVLECAKIVGIEAECLRQPVLHRIKMGLVASATPATPHPLGHCANMGH